PQKSGPVSTSAGLSYPECARFASPNGLAIATRSCPVISIALIFAAASLSSPSVVEAERAYAAMAQKDGQWTAFRATAAPRAVLFVPDPVDAASWLQGKKDPPTAVKWQPAAAFVACDGKAAVTTGPWQRPISVGYFTTIWSRPGTTWRWNVD